MTSIKRGGAIALVILSAGAGSEQVESIHSVPRESASDVHLPWTPAFAGEAMEDGLNPLSTAAVCVRAEAADPPAG